MSDNSVVRFLGGDNMRKSNEFGERYFYTTRKRSKFFSEKSLKRKSLAASIGGQAIHVTLNYSAE